MRVLRLARVGSAPGERATWPGWKHLSPCGKLAVGMNEYCQLFSVGLRTCRELSIPTQSAFNYRCVMCEDGVLTST